MEQFYLIVFSLLIIHFGFDAAITGISNIGLWKSLTTWDKVQTPHNTNGKEVDQQTINNLSASGSSSSKPTSNYIITISNGSSVYPVKQVIL